MSSNDSYDEDDVVAEYEPEEDQIEQNPRGEGTWISALIALLGLWVVAAPFVFEAVRPAFEILEAHFWSDVIVGLALIMLGAYNFYRRRDERLASVGAAALAALLGLWLIATPFVFGTGIDAGGLFADVDLGLWSDVVVGVLVLLLGAYSIYEAREHKVPRTTET